MDAESVERLIEIILQMKINLVHVTETLHQQTHEIRQQLGAIFESERKGLQGCLNQIDDKLRECALCVEDYKRSYANLASMREKLVQLGAHPSILPEGLPSAEIDAIVAWRLHELHSQGRI
jgi:hypothetical protein